VLRVPEIAFMIIFPAASPHNGLLSVAYRQTDIVALATMGVGLAGLLWVLWRATNPAARVQGRPREIEVAGDVEGGVAA